MKVDYKLVKIDASPVYLVVQPWITFQSIDEIVYIIDERMDRFFILRRTSAVIFRRIYDLEGSSIGEIIYNMFHEMDEDKRCKIETFVVWLMENEIVGFKEKNKHE